MTELFEGLTPVPRSDWPPLISNGGDDVIAALRPDSRGHEVVLNYMTSRIRQSEMAMSVFYDRWRIAEKKIQAYIDLPHWEKELKDLTDEGKPAKPVRLTVPYSFATISTIVAFLMHTFTGKRPMFQVGSHKQEAMNSARNMELTIQYNADHVRLVRHLFQFFTDAELYGVSFLGVSWQEERVMRTVRIKQPALIDQATPFGVPIENWAKKRELKLVYSGNDVISRDPFNVFPDPRVPMAEVAKRGEFVFWRTFEGRHMLKRLEASEEFMWVDNAGDTPPMNFSAGDSARGLVSGGRPFPGAGAEVNVTGAGSGSGATAQGRNFVQVDQGSIDIIPRELGISPSERVEKWIFTMLNKKQIVQARRMIDDHGQHPIVVAEPYSLGYGFGHPSMADFLGPIQDIVSWYVNSHIDNVRRVLNDIMIVDPSAIEIQDLKNPGPGAIIRMKRAAHGRDVRSILQQLPIQDVTSGHMRDAELMMTIGQRLSAVTDNLTGLSSQVGGRRTATEVRTRSEGAVSRLASHARLYSSMAMVNLTEMMSLNIQQYMDSEFYLELLGADGARDSIIISPEMLIGDFHFPVHDGTLPIDKVALFEIWTQIFGQVQTDPLLRQAFSISKIFEHIAELGGAKNIESFRIDMRPDKDIEAELQAGNMIPAGNGGGSASGGRRQSAITQLPNLPSNQIASMLG